MTSTTCEIGSRKSTMNNTLEAMKESTYWYAHAEVYNKLLQLLNNVCSWLEFEVRFWYVAHPSFCNYCICQLISDFNTNKYVYQWQFTFIIKFFCPSKSKKEKHSTVVPRLLSYSTNSPWKSDLPAVFTFLFSFRSWVLRRTWWRRWRIL